MNAVQVLWALKQTQKYQAAFVPLIRSFVDVACYERKVLIVPPYVTEWRFLDTGKVGI